MYGTVRGRLFLIFLSGTAFSFPYFSEGAFPLTYFALTVFFTLLWREPLRGKEFRACFCFCLGVQSATCSWFVSMYPLAYFGFSKFTAFLLVAACCVVLPACFSAMMAAVLQFGRFLPENPVLRALGYGALWVLAEHVLTYGDMAFPWATVALSQTGCLPLLKTVSLFGSGWLAFFSVTVCALLAGAFLHKKRSLLIAGSAMFASGLLLGGVLLFLPAEAGEIIPAAAIQGNITTEEKWDDSKLPNIFSTYTRLTEQAAKSGAKLILLPESAVPVNFEENGVLHEAFAKIAKEYDCTIVMGILRRRDDKLYNSLVAVCPDGSLSTYYNKRRAVPFGEVMPFEAFLPDLGLGTSLTVGETDAFIESGTYRMGCFICFDSVFSGAAQAEANTDFLLLSTNDAWFKDSVALDQHLRFAKLRAAESGRTLLRAGNTGFSAFIDAKGILVSKTDPLEEAILYGELTVQKTMTLFSVTGDLFPILSVLFLCTVLIISWCRTALLKRYCKFS